MLAIRMKNERPGADTKPFYAGNRWVTKFVMAWRNLAREEFYGKTVSEDQVAVRFREFTETYRNESQKFISAIVHFSNTGEALKPVTADEVRKAILGRDGNIWPFIVTSSPSSAYSELFAGARLAAVDEAAAQYRIPIIGGNLKREFEKPEELEQLLLEIMDTLTRHKLHPANVDVFIAPSDIHIERFANTLRRLEDENRIPKGLIRVGAQNVAHGTKGAYTGQHATTNQLKAYGVHYVIVGHSEVRRGNEDEPESIRWIETNEEVNVKVLALLQAGLTPVLAVGESADENKDGYGFEVVKEQLLVGLQNVTADQMLESGLVIAYEPVWAIGKKALRVATPAEANEMQRFIRGLILEKYGKDIASKIRIQYGGSMKADNAQGLMLEKNIDGGLIGGAAKQGNTFVPLIAILAEARNYYASAANAKTYADKWDEEVQLEVQQNREKLLSLAPEGLILDVGTGSGRDASWFVSQGRQVIGSDKYEAMLEEARQRHPEVTFIQEPMTSLSAETSSVSAVFSNASVIHLHPDETATAIGEFQRALKDDGILFLRVKKGKNEGPDSLGRYTKEYMENELTEIVTRGGFQVLSVDTRQDSATPTQPARDIVWIDLFAKKSGARLASVDFLAPVQSIRNALKDRYIHGWTVNYRAVLNVKSKAGEIKDDTRLRDIVDDLRFLVLEKGANVNLIGHLGRREEIAGVIKDDRESLKLVADRLQELLGPGIPVKFNAQSVVENGLNLSWSDIRSNQEQFGKPMVNVIENTRFANAEQAKISSPERVEFGRSLASLTGELPGTKKILIFGAFADLNSKGASVEDLPGHVDEVYAGTAMEKEIAEVNRVLSDGVDAVIFSGSKPDKINFLKGLVPALREGGFVLAGSSASYALNGELSALRDEIRGGNAERLVTAVNYERDAESNVVDIDSETIAKYLAKLDTLKTGQTLLLNGTQGYMEKGYTRGNDAILDKVKALAQRGVKIVVIGGDASDYGRKAGLDKLPNVVFFTGAQVPFAMLAGEKLVGLEALKAKAITQNVGARLTITRSVSTDAIEVPVTPSNAVTFIVRVHSETNQTGKLMLGSLLLDYRENADGSLTIQGLDEKERIINPDEWTKTTLESGQSAFQITFSMSDFKQALDVANQTVEEAPISKALNNIKAVGVIDLDGLNPNVKGFDEVVIPLLIEELKLAHKRPWGQNAKFLLKGSEALIQRISSQIPEGQDFIVIKEEDLGTEYAGASHILITTPGKFEKGMRHFFIQSPQEGDIPNFRGALRGSLSLARVDKLEATNKDFSEIRDFVGRLLGHEITNPSEYIQVTENPALIAIEKIRDLYSLPAITRLPLNQIVQGARLAIRMIQQAA